MNADVLALIDKAQQSLAAADLLKEGGFLSFAASRGYYAMFYAAEALLLSRGAAYSSHAAVIAAFGREFAKTQALDRRLHQWLINAFNMRNMGDYDARVDFTDDQVGELLTWARDFVRDARVFLGGADATATQADSE